MQNHPNFFIVGAPKCGTTSLAGYLAEHPGVFVTSPKEPNYFARELAVNASKWQREQSPWTYDLSSYLSLYQSAPPEKVAFGEASTTYLSTASAIPEIFSRYAAARIIVMVRSPIQLAHSLHGQKLIEGEESIRDFHEAWQAQQERQSNPEQVNALRPGLLQYGKIASIGSQLRHLLTVFPRRQVKVIFLEDFRNDSRKVYQETLEFLEVPDDQRTEFPVLNRGRNISTPMLWRMSAAKMPLLLAPYRYLRGKLDWEWGGRVRRWLAARSMSDDVDRSLASEFAETLLEYFEDEIQIVESITGRQLTHWRDIQLTSKSSR